MRPAKPLVLADDPSASSAGQPIIQRLQGSTELDIPLEERFRALNAAFSQLLACLSEQGFELTENLIEYSEQKENILC